jgi:SecD/SecF fusion protein
MQRNYLRGLLICLVPCLLAALFVIRLDKYKYGIDLAGGTILVYEVNLERTKQRLELMGETTPSGRPQRSASSGSSDGLGSDKMRQLAAEIKRRIDPTDIKNVTVRPLGDNRVEIIIPFAGAASGKANLTAEDVEEVKRLISQMGVLEFRILANGTDDQEGITAARQAVDTRSPADMESRALAGQPPEPPDGEFSVDIGESKAKVRYVWVELGPEERESLGLSNISAAQPNPLWREAAANRLTGKTFGVMHTQQGYLPTADYASAAFILYSRECKSRDQLGKEEMDEKRLRAEHTDWPEEKIQQNLDKKKFEYFILTRLSPEDSLRVGGDITLTASSITDPKTFNPAVEFRFNGAGAQQFGKITRRNKPSGNITRQLAILLDDRVVSAPSIQSEINAIGTITGKFDRKTVDRLVQILRSGALSAELREKPVSENTIGPTLGKDTIQKGIRAVGVAFVAILIFMLIYYRFAGVVACIALFANLLLTVGFMVAVNAAFTLPGLAGLVLTLGMAVDANVLIYERLREERNKGANIITAIRNGYERAFPTIIDTHLTSIFTAIVLYTFGNDSLKGFAITLTAGLAISLFTSLYMTRLIFDYWQHKKLLTDLSMMRLFGKLGFHPMKYRHFFFALTGISSVLGLALFVYRGEAGLNVDFRGGTVFAGRLKEGQERALTTIGDKPGFRDLLSDENQKKRLNAISARWDNQPVPKSPDGKLTPEEIALVGTYVYTITYDDKTTATVTLNHKPEGNTPEEMERDLIEDRPTRRGRARHLPDVSVEQTFRLGESFPEGKSRDFTIRTTERQPELVRVSLDRLFRDSENNSIIDGTIITKTDIKGPIAELTFSRPTSRNFMQELLDREFKKIGASGEGESFKLTGDEKTLKDGRYEKMTLDVSKNPTFSKLAAQPPVPDTDPEKKGQMEAFAKIVSETKQAFDASPEPERLEVFDSQLASETRNKALYAILASWVAILLYLWFRFGNWTFGAAAVICLIHDLCFTLGAIAVCHYLFAIPGMGFLGLEDFKIDLAAVAALLTLVGYSVSDTIVVFDRIREVRGKNPKLTAEMIDDSVNQTLSRTILTATTVFLVSIVLYVFGGEGVHLFAFVMVMGVLVGTYSSIFVAAPLLLIFGEGHERAAVTTTEETPEKEEAEEEVLEG